MSDFGLETNMGLQGEGLRVVVRWFDHNNLGYMTLVRVGILQADKPRTLVVEVCTVPEDKGVSPDALEPVEVYRMEGGEDPRAMSKISLKMNPMVKQLIDENRRLRGLCEEARTALVKLEKFVRVEGGENSHGTIIVAHLNPGQRFVHDGVRYIIPEQDPHFAQFLNIPPHQEQEGNVMSRYPMKLVGRDVKDDAPLRKGIRLEFMNPYTEVEVLE